MDRDINLKKMIKEIKIIQNNTITSIKDQLLGLIVKELVILIQQWQAEKSQ